MCRCCPQIQRAFCMRGDCIPDPNNPAFSVEANNGIYYIIAKDNKMLSADEVVEELNKSWEQ